MRNPAEVAIKLLISQNNHDMNISFPAVVLNTDNLIDGFIDVKPIINYVSPLTGESVEYPTLHNIKVVFPSTMSSTVCFPVQQGDTVSLLVQSSDIQSFLYGETEPHDPLMLSYGNLANVVAIVGFTPYQQSCFNPMNYKNDFDNQDLNIVHNKNTDNEAIISINTDGDISLRSPTTVNIESKEVNVVADTINANSAVLSTDGDVEINGKSVKEFMLSHTHTGNQGSPTSPPNN